MIGAKLGVPVVPVRLVGADRLLHQTAPSPMPGRVTVRFGQPLYLQGDDYATLAKAGGRGRPRAALGLTGLADHNCTDA